MRRLHNILTGVALFLLGASICSAKADTCKHRIIFLPQTHDTQFATVTGPADSEKMRSCDTVVRKKDELALSVSIGVKRWS